jgi:exodeoxyribonuclease-3
MLVASWNVNSIRSRLERVTAWLERQRPDVLCLQETKVTDEAFPAETFRAFGYESTIFGQKSYNGVAILSRQPAEAVTRGMDDGEDDSSARLLGATIGGVRIYSVYVPNGQVVGSEAWEFKLRWLARLKATLVLHHRPSDRLVLGGDFNIAPEERDVYNPQFWKSTVLFHPVVREALTDLCSFGLVDTFRLHNEAGGLYSWWDYRAMAFPRNLGLRIDLMLASQGLAPQCTAASIDREARKGAGASDHAPILAQFDVPRFLEG